jgi:sucrose-6-phosphate hydrolase SacC (GH32 family)
MSGFRLLMLAAGLMGGATPGGEKGRADLPLAEFQSGYGTWRKEGAAFVIGPAGGKELADLDIVNAGTDKVITSERRGDEPQGMLTSPEFVVERDYIAFRIGGGDFERHCCLELWSEGRVVRSATGRNSDRLSPQSWDVRDVKGKRAHLRVVDRASGDWGHINVDCLVQTDRPEQKPVDVGALYDEAFRPQFHFTARQWTMNRLNPGMRQEGWINDLNGLICYDGEYHLFAQRWHKCWLHAVSRDLMHWTELEPAFWAEELDEGVQSGTCVVDYGNTSGLSPDPKNPAMVAFWSDVENKSQWIHYSLDHGRSWTRFSGNPVLQASERDPKVFWYEPGKHWVMILYGGGKYQFFTSPNLLDWKDEHSVIEDGFECPDFFELPVDGNEQDRRWVLVHGDGRYSVGRFDGRAFQEDTIRRPGDIGPNFYATQSWENTKTGDGRRIQAAWMRGSDFPGMPFSQQISFPCELTLHTTREGPRLFRSPIKEIEDLHDGHRGWQNERLEAGRRLPLAVGGDLYHIKAKVTIEPGASLTFQLRGISVTLTDKTIQSGGASAQVLDEVRTVEILLDRGSIEVFVNGGEISSTRYVLPFGQGMSVEAAAGEVQIESIDVFKLKSVWNEKEEGLSNAEIRGPSKMHP